MSTQATTWPNGLYPADETAAAKSAIQKSSAATRPLALHSAVENVPAIVFSAFFVAEVALIAGGLGIILASLATLVLQGATR